MSNPTFLLVTGSIRSGTTLLGELLYSRYEDQKRCRHPQLSFANDNINTLRELVSIHARLAKESGKPDIQRSIRTLLEKYHCEDTSLTGLPQLLQKQILEVAPIGGCPPKVYGIKSTGLFDDFLWMKQALGRTRQIIIFRDPRDVLFSSLRRVSLMERPSKSMSRWQRIKTQIMGRQYDPTVPRPEEQNYDAYVAITMTLNAYRFWKAHHLDQDVLMVRYEDLVHDPEKGMRGILRFLDLPEESYDWDSLKSGSIVSNSSFLIKDPDGAVPTGIQVSSIGRYKNSLSQFDLWLTQRVLGPMMQELGYPLDDGGGYQPQNSSWRAWMSGLIARTKTLGHATDGLEAVLQ
jgi:hypothetical protein